MEKNKNEGAGEKLQKRNKKLKRIFYATISLTFSLYPARHIFVR